MIFILFMQLRDNTKLFPLVKSAYLFSRYFYIFMQTNLSDLQKIHISHCNFSIFCHYCDLIVKLVSFEYENNVWNKVNNLPGYLYNIEIETV